MSVLRATEKKKQQDLNIIPCDCQQRKGGKAWLPCVPYEHM